MTILPNIQYYEGIDFDEEEFKKVKLTLKRKLDFEGDQYSDNFLKRRITVRLKAKNINDLNEYHNILIDSIEEQELLLKNLTIHVTEFFRDTSFWEHLKTDFFPKIIEENKDKQKIKIWSAGCSSGQEAISILITFLEIDEKLKDKIEIIATDISQDVLEKAEKSEYDAFGIKGLSEQRKEKYFDDDGKNLTLKPEYKKHFEFKKHDILKDDLFKDFQALFFRNTVIYFSMEAKERLYKHLFDNMPHKSYLLLGKTESLTGESRNHFKVINGIERIFQVL